MVVERKALPLNPEEAEHWMERSSNESTEISDRLFANSREAMIIDGEERALDDGGVAQTTTLITQHVVVAGESESPKDQQERNGMFHEREPSHESSGKLDLQLVRNLYTHCSKTKGENRRASKNVKITKILYFKSLW